MPKALNGGDAAHGSRAEGCRGCGAGIDNLPSRRRYCDKCAEHRRAKQPRLVGSCRECSEPLIAAHANRKLCDACKAARKATHAASMWSGLTAEQRQAKSLRRRVLRFGIDETAYDQMFAEQGGRCAICGTNAPRGRGDFHIDHCHETGRVRGLLCSLCNVGLGHFGDDTDRLKRAIEYLYDAEAEYLWTDGMQFDPRRGIEAYRIAQHSVVFAAEDILRQESA